MSILLCAIVSNWVLSYLFGCERGVSVNTQKNSPNALAYLFQKFLKREMGDLGFRLRLNSVLCRLCCLLTKLR